MKFQFYLLIFSIFIIGCNQIKKEEKEEVKTEIIEIKNIFKEEEVKWFKNKGTATIKGVARFKSKKGNIRFGEEFSVELMPYTAYSEERLSHIYKDKKADFVFAADGVPKFTPDPKGYHDTIKVTCNADGTFEYSNLPSGKYYIVAFMIFDGGGGIMRHFELKEGENKTLEMTNY
ncbi:hypothetical protein [Tenacibaculum jejuense]|uniref:Lipoprotein n=1 Tax=Tenacibaculum jejuense TaxID=584609 RepID=A0A238U773_9FLAO|nr:hypothetical protein [Tenacibaculum jejuense]SNR14952.1 conserved protein of unknown function [Tenacibaculum jejuense]